MKKHTRMWPPRAATCGGIAAVIVRKKQFLKQLKKSEAGGVMREKGGGVAEVLKSSSWDAGGIEAQAVPRSKAAISARKETNKHRGEGGRTRTGPSVPVPSCLY